MKIFLTGGMGFIGSNFAEALLKKNHEVTIYDNLSTGFKRFVKFKKNFNKLKVIYGDLKDFKKLKKSIKNHDIVLHFAANADVRYGFSQPKKDLEQNIVCTHNLLEAMRKNNIKKIVFSSTGSVYGEAKKFPIKENSEFPIQTSFYGRQCNATKIEFFKKKKKSLFCKRDKIILGETLRKIPNI